MDRTSSCNNTSAKSTRGTASTDASSLSPKNSQIVQCRCSDQHEGMCCAFGSCGPRTYRFEFSRHTGKDSDLSPPEMHVRIRIVNESLLSFGICAADFIGPLKNVMNVSEHIYAILQWMQHSRPAGMLAFYRSGTVDTSAYTNCRVIRLDTQNVTKTNGATVCGTYALQTTKTIRSGQEMTINYVHLIDILYNSYFINGTPSMLVPTSLDYPHVEWPMKEIQTATLFPYVEPTLLSSAVVYASCEEDNITLLSTPVVLIPRPKKGFVETHAFKLMTTVYAIGQRRGIPIIQPCRVIECYRNSHEIIIYVVRSDQPGHSDKHLPRWLLFHYYEDAIFRLHHLFTGDDRAHIVRYCSTSSTAPAAAKLTNNLVTHYASLFIPPDTAASTITKKTTADTLPITFGEDPAAAHQSSSETN